MKMREGFGRPRKGGGGGMGQGAQRRRGAEMTKEVLVGGESTEEPRNRENQHGKSAAGEELKKRPGSVRETGGNWKMGKVERTGDKNADPD